MFIPHWIIEAIPYFSERCKTRMNMAPLFPYFHSTRSLCLVSYVLWYDMFHGKITRNNLCAESLLKPSTISFWKLAMRLCRSGSESANCSSIDMVLQQTRNRVLKRKFFLVNLVSLSLTFKYANLMEIIIII